MREYLPFKDLMKSNWNSNSEVSKVILKFPENKSFQICQMGGNTLKEFLMLWNRFITEDSNVNPKLLLTGRRLTCIGDPITGCDFRSKKYLAIESEDKFKPEINLDWYLNSEYHFMKVTLTLLFQMCHAKQIF